MEWQVIVALLVMIPIILFPAAFIWYLNISGVVAAWKGRKAKEKGKRGRLLAKGIAK